MLIVGLVLKLLKLSGVAINEYYILNIFLTLFFIDDLLRFTYQSYKINTSYAFLSVFV